MNFVAFLYAAQNCNRVFDARFADHDGLKTSLKRGVLLDIFAVFVERRRADTTKFAARQHRLEDIAGVHCAFRLARANDRVHFVDKQQDLPVRLLNFVEYGF